MNVSQERQALDVFEQVVLRAEGERDAALERLCGSDVLLRERVEELLAADLGGDDLLGQVERDMHLAELTGRPSRTRIGSYEIVEELGRGAMGVVYRARQERPTREVALKLLHPGVSLRETRQRFRNEIETLGRLQHPGIAAIHDAGVTDDGEPFIVMELVRGRPLGGLLKQRITLEQRINLLVRVGEALAYAHRQGVIHRDLKPANILVEQVGDELRPRILDFGVARVLDADPQQSLMTQPGQLLGTLAYMSPEQARGDRTLDTRTDVYALAALAYELLAGRLPIDLHGEPITRAVERIENERPQRIAATVGHNSDDLDLVLRTGLAKDREQRYASVEAFTSDLQRWLRHEPITARPPSLWYEARRFAQRRRGIVASLTAIAALTIVAFAGLAYGFLTERDANERLSETAIAMVEDMLALQSVSGTAEVRTRALQRLRSQVELLLEQDPDNVRLRAAYADTLSALGGLALAEQRLDEALTLQSAAYDELLGIPPGERAAKVTQSLWDVRVRLGDVHRALGNRQAALELYLEQYRVEEQALATDPDDQHARNAVLWSHTRISNIYLELGQLDTALEWADRGLSAGQAYVADYGETAGGLHALSALYATQAGVQKKSNAPAGDLLATGNARLAIARRLVALDPDNRHRLAELTGSLVSASHRSLVAGSTEAALDQLHEAAGHQQRQVELDPQDRKLRERLINIRHGIANSLRRLGRFEEALAAAESALDAGGGLLTPEHEPYWRLLDVHITIAKLHRDLGDSPEDIIAHCDAAEAGADALLEHHPEHARTYMIRAESLLQRPDATAADLEAARDAMERCIELTPLPADAHWRLLAEAEEKLGNYDAALASLKNSDELLPADHINRPSLERQIERIRGRVERP